MDDSNHAEDDHVVNNGNGTNISGKKRKSLYQLPSKEEQMHLRETEDLMRTNLIKLQVDELLHEIRVDGPSKHTRRLDEWIVSLADYLKKGKLEKKKPLNQEWLESMKIPLTLEAYDRKPVELLFKPPKAIDVVGSYIHSNATKPFLNIDLVVTIPDECMDSRDVLNHIYFDKRKLYLGALLHLLKNNSELVNVETLSFALFKADDRKPIIVLKPAFQTKYMIRIIPVVSNNLFQVSRLEPIKNNVRPIEWMKMLEDKARHKDHVATNIASGAMDGMDTSLLEPTPDYNAAILEDIAFLNISQTVTKAMTIPSIRDASLLFKVWLKQCGQRFGCDSFDSFCASALLVYLLSSRTITSHMSALHTFQACLKFLADSSLPTSTLNMTGESSSRQGDRQAAVLLHTVGNGSHNCWWRVSQSALSELIIDAKQSLLSLQKAEFSSVFLRERNFFENSDIFLHIPLGRACHRGVVEGEELYEREKVHYEAIHAGRCGKLSWRLTAAYVVSLLKDGLADRVAAIRCFSFPFSPSLVQKHATLGGSLMTSASDYVSSHYPLWSTTQSAPALPKTIIVGLRLSADIQKQMRRVDRGPSAEDEAALVQFRDLWGPIAQLRRFRDGAIVEAVVWPKTTSGGALVEHIAKHLLARHLGLKNDVDSDTSSQAFSRSTTSLTAWLPGPQETAADAHEHSHAEFVAAVRAFDKFRSLILSGELTGFPLAVEGLSAICPELRYTALFPPCPHPLVEGDKAALRSHAGHKLTRLVQIIPALITLRKSVSWPADIQALHHTKVAMLIRLREVLLQLHHIKSVVHGDADNVSLDIFYEGYVFRIFIDSSTYKTAASVVAETKTSEIDSEPGHDTLQAHHNLVHSLSARFPSYGETSRLFALWMAKHFFSGCLRHETMELIVASVYLQDPPSSAFVGLLRVLDKLYRHDWEEEPLVLDFATLNDNSIQTTNSYLPLGSEDLLAVQTRFKSERMRAHSHAVYIVSSLDRTSSNVFHKETNANQTVVDFPPNIFSAKFPEKVVLNRMRADAQESLFNLRKWATGENDRLLLLAMCSKLTPIAWNVVIKFQKNICCPALHGSADNIPRGHDLWNAVLVGPESGSIKIYSNLSDAELSGRNLVPSEGSAHPNPIQAAYVKKLRSTFGHIAVFFWDHTKGDEVGVVWRPNTFLPVKFSVTESKYRIPYEATESETAETMTIYSVSSILAEMMALGEGIVDTVDIR